MKKATPFALFFFWSVITCLNAQSTTLDKEQEPTSDWEQSIAAVRLVQDFFVAFHAQDTLALRQMTVAGVLQQTIIPTSQGKPKEVKLVNFNSFLKRIATLAPNSFKEQILDYKPRVTQYMAHIYTPYAFYVNGNYSHGGTNAFTLVAINGRWKIAHIIDTRKK